MVGGVGWGGGGYFCGQQMHPWNSDKDYTACDSSNARRQAKGLDKKGTAFPNVPTQRPTVDRQKAHPASY